MPHLPTLPLDMLLPWIGATCGLVALGAALFFRASRNARLKRGVWVGLIVAGDLLFLAVIALMDAPWFLIGLAVAVTVIGARQSLRLTRFCSDCGGNHFPMSGDGPPVFCRHCGARFDAGPRVPAPR